MLFRKMPMPNLPLAPFREVRDSAHAFSQAEVIDHLRDLSLQQQRRGFYGMIAGVLARQSPKKSQSACTNALISILTEDQSNDFQAGLDGVMGGLFIALGEQALPILERRGLFENEASPVDQRHLLQALRFCWEYPSDTVPRTEVILITRKLLPVPHLTREVIVDLSRYMDWDFCNQIVAMWDTLGGEGPLIRPAIIGYLLACPSEKVLLFSLSSGRKISSCSKKLNERRQYPFLLLHPSASSIVRRTIEYPDRSCEIDIQFLLQLRLSSRVRIYNCSSRWGHWFLPTGSDNIRIPLL